jgi:CMP-N,N'-diacetyllegionaminic acid synthase
MSFDGFNILAVVPARGGSKGIPRKNLQLVGGLSLVARAAGVARSLDWLDAAVISTDDPEMAEEGRRYGLDVPFMRPAELAGDKSLGIDVWRHAWLASEEHYGKRFDISVKLEPTSPLRRPEDVERTVRKLIDGGHPAAATVSPTPAHYSPHKTLTVSDDGIIGFYLADGAAFSLRQGIPQYYHRNGICYAAVRAHVVDRRMIIDQDAAAVIIERPVVNIDEALELELAAWLLEREKSAGSGS